MVQKQQEKSVLGQQIRQIKFLANESGFGVPTFCNYPKDNMIILGICDMEHPKWKSVASIKCKYDKRKENFTYTYAKWNDKDESPLRAFDNHITSKMKTDINEWFIKQRNKINKNNKLIKNTRIEDNGEVALF